MSASNAKIVIEYYRKYYEEKCDCEACIPAAKKQYLNNIGLGLVVENDYKQIVALGNKINGTMNLDDERLECVLISEMTLPLLAAGHRATFIRRLKKYCNADVFHYVACKCAHVTTVCRLLILLNDVESLKIIADIMDVSFDRHMLCSALYWNKSIDMLELITKLFPKDIECSHAQEGIIKRQKTVSE